MIWRAWYYLAWPWWPWQQKLFAVAVTCCCVIWGPWLLWIWLPLVLATAVISDDWV